MLIQKHIYLQSIKQGIKNIPRCVFSCAIYVHHQPVCLICWATALPRSGVSLCWIFTTKPTSDGHRTEQMRYDKVHTTIRVISITLGLPYTAPPQNDDAAQVSAPVALFAFKFGNATRGLPVCSDAGRK